MCVFQVVPSVPRIRERVVQSTDQLRGLDVRPILIAEDPALNSEDEAQRLDLARQFRKRERNQFPLIEIVELEGLEIADQDEAWAVALRNGVEILLRLPAGFLEIPAGALLLDDKNTGPEEVDKAGAIVELGDMLLVAGDLSTALPKHLKEFIAEALRFPLLVGRVTPFICKSGGLHANLVPIKAH